ncbi:NAAT family transporter [Candidatus Woesearchaeota archaeon]|nr:NAAT family transporter [Candidatus Woesearchaeota archaeon]
MLIESTFLNIFIYSFVTLFVVVNPFSTASIFLALTEKAKKEEKLEIASGATLISLIILSIFGFSGYFIFKFFGISLGAFRIAGGIILLNIAFRMIKGEHKKLHHSHFEVDEVMIVPLAIPLIAGPGSISTIVVLISDNPGFTNYFLIFLALLINMALMYVILRNSDDVKSFLKERGIRVLNKVMGIIIMALSVQFIINGIAQVLPTILSQL